jgi:hypothetical protein
MQSRSRAVGQPRSRKCSRAAAQSRSRKCSRAVAPSQTQSRGRGMTRHDARGLRAAILERNGGRPFPETIGWTGRIHGSGSEFCVGGAVCAASYAGHSPGGGGHAVRGALSGAHIVHTQTVRCGYSPRDGQWPWKIRHTFPCVHQDLSAVRQIGLHRATTCGRLARVVEGTLERRSAPLSEAWTVQ